MFIARLRSQSEPPAKYPSLHETISSLPSAVGHVMHLTLNVHFELKSRPIRMRLHYKIMWCSLIANLANYRCTMVMYQSTRTCMDQALDKIEKRLGTFTINIKPMTIHKISVFPLRSLSHRTVIIGYPCVPEWHKLPPTCPNHELKFNNSSMFLLKRKFIERKIFHMFNLSAFEMDLAGR